MKSKYFVILCMSLVSSVAVLSFLKKDVLYSVKENRLYEQAPMFSLYGWFDRSYSRNLEHYLEDQLAFRNPFLDLKFLSERGLGKTKFNGIYLGDDGYMMKIETYDDEVLDQNIEILEQFALNYDASLYLLPSSSYLLEDHLPGNVEDQKQKKYFATMRDLPWVKAMDDVLYPHGLDSVFYRSDHHITTQGMRYIYEAWCKEERQFSAQVELEQVSTKFLGSYARASNNIFAQADEILIHKRADEYLESIRYDDAIEKDSLYEKKYLGKQDEYALFLDGNHGITEIQSNAGTGKQLLMLKDSYGNSFAPYLMSHYDRIILIDLSLYQGDIQSLLEEEEQDILLFYHLHSLQQKAITKLRVSQ